MATLRDKWMSSRRRRDELLSAYLDDELSAAERARVEAKLAADSAWQSELAALRRTIELVRMMPRVDVSRNFILRQAPERRARIAAAPGRSRAWVAPLLTVATAAVSLLFLVAVAGSLIPPLGHPAAYESSAKPQLSKAPVAAEATVLVEAEIEVAVTEEVEEEMLLAAPAEEAAEEAPSEEAEPESAPLWAPTEAVVESAERSFDDEPGPAPPELEAEALGAPEQPGAREALGEPAEGTGDLNAGTVPAETADDGVMGTPKAAVAGGGPTLPPVRQPTETEEPAPSGPSGQTEAPPHRESAPAPATEDEEPIPTAPTATPSARPEGAGATPTVAERAVLRDTGTPLGVPWLAIQIGLGSTAIALLLVTIWAWRMRR